MDKHGNMVQLAAALLFVGLAILSGPLHAVPFEWREAALPVENMRLTRVAAGPDSLMAIGRIGVAESGSDSVVATSSDGLDWRIVDIGLEEWRKPRDIIHIDDGFIVLTTGGHLFIENSDGGWTIFVPPAEARLRSASLVEHQGRLLLFGRVSLDERILRIVATEDFESWDVLYERVGIRATAYFGSAVSSGWAMATSFLQILPLDGNNLWFSTDGSNWENFDDGGSPYFVFDSLTTRGSILYASVPDFFGSPEPLQIFRRGPDDADWQRSVYPEFMVESTGPIQGGPPGLVMLATFDEQPALLTSIDGDSWSRQEFVPSGEINDFVAWGGNWIGVGETATRGQIVVPESTPVPAVSGTALILVALLLGLVALRRLSRRAG